MARGTSVSDNRLPGRLSAVITAAALVAFGLALAAAVVLWIHYGTAVFFQMLVAGIAACF
jgi:hypothetical protein